MKRLFIPAALLLLVAHQAVAAQKSDRDRHELIGAVRSVESFPVYLIEAPGKEPRHSQQEMTVTSFDADGRATEVVVKIGTRVLSRHTISYDASGSRIRESRDETRKEREPQRSITLFKYDERGNVIEEETRWLGRTNFRQVRYTYDSKDRIKEEVVLESERSPIAIVYSYRDDSPLAESATQISNNKPVRSDTHIYEFDSRGNWVKRATKMFNYRDGKPVQTGSAIMYRKITYAAAQGGVETTAANDMPAPDEKLAQMSLPKIIRKSGGVLQQSAKRKVIPEYPSDARAKGVRGAVVIELTVDEDGNVIETRPVSGPQELLGAAEEAAKQWKFTPTRLSGVPVKVIGTITFNFN